MVLKQNKGKTVIWEGPIPTERHTLMVRVVGGTKYIYSILFATARGLGPEFGLTVNHAMVKRLGVVMDLLRNIDSHDKNLF